MREQQKLVADQCRKAAHDISSAFPEIVRRLIEAGIESDAIDLRSGAATCDLQDGGSVAPYIPGAIAQLMSSPSPPEAARA